MFGSEPPKISTHLQIQTSNKPTVVTSLPAKERNRRALEEVWLVAAFRKGKCIRREKLGSVVGGRMS